MGLFSGIKKAFKGIVGGVKNFAKNALQTVIKKATGVIGPILGKVSGFLDKLPGGLGGLVKDFAGKFLTKGLSLLSPSVLGGIGSILKFAGNAPKAVLDLLSAAMKMQGVDAKGQQNLVGMSAQYFAANLFR